MPPIARRPIREMSQRRRHQGLSQIDLHQIEVSLRTVLSLLVQVATIPILALRVPFLVVAANLLRGIIGMFTLVYQVLDPIDPANRDRLIASYTDEECYYLFRLRKTQLTDLFARLNLPQIIRCENGIVCPGEHALLVYLYHLTCPTILLRMQKEFGRETSQLCRIEKYIKSYLITNYRRFVIGNLMWYEDRFEQYADVVNTKVAYSPHNIAPGTIPHVLYNIVGFIDGSSFPVARITGLNNAQLAFWNGYYHCHMVLWMGVSLPDSMIILENPNPGYMTDPMVWPNSRINADMTTINATRAANNLEPFRLCGDKIFQSDQNLFAMYSRRWGPVTPWMTNINHIMSPLRVSIEWCYGKVKYLFKKLSVKMAQKMMLNNPVEDFILATFFTNCRTCYNWDGPFRKTFTIPPPNIDDYLNQ